jgi:asparagine synthase (glutamine-hydrolysing)
LAESIRLHALADAPVGVFLSGGIDSTAVAALMRPHMPRLRAYTLRFPDVPGGDESRVAEQSARVLDCNLTTVDVDGATVRECLPQFASDLDQPSLDGLNTWLISRAAARDVKGVLSGLGGDEWFAGYPVTHRMHRCARAWPGRAMAAAGALAEPLARWLAPDSTAHPLARLAARRSPWALWLQTHTLTTPDVAARATGHAAGGAGDLRRWLAAQLDGELGPHESPVGLSCLLDARVFMGCQLLRDSDAASMAHSLELRVPLVDVELAAFARSCRDEYKLPEGRAAARASRGPAGKRVLLAALADVLPRGVLEQPKRGFALPLETWLRRDLRELLAETCDPATIRRRGLIDPDVLAGAGYLPDLAASNRPARPGYPRAWCLMILELWCRAVLDTAPRPAAPVDGGHALPQVASVAAPSA